MTYYPEQGRIHAVIVLEKNLDSKKVCHTRCGKQLPFGNIVTNDDKLNSLPQCKVCLDASRDQLALAPGFRKIYLREE